MLQILFWNMNGNPLAVGPLERPAREHRADIVILAEWPDPDVAEALLDASHGELALVGGRVHRRIAVYARPEAGVGPAVGESAYMVIHPVRWRNSRHEFLLASVHGISRLEAEATDLDEEACLAAGLVRDVERARGHRRSVVVGDLNLNPFDEGIAKARGFHGVMTKADASRGARRVRFGDYPLFYNPMWSRMGDESVGPPGTYYRDRSSHLTYYWHTSDQVLIRPAVLPAYDGANLVVPVTAGDVPLLRGGVPDAVGASDHLPVVLGLNLKRLGGPPW